MVCSTWVQTASVTLGQIENIRCFTSAVASLWNSSQTGLWLHTCIMFVCGKYEPNASHQQAGQKLWTQSGHVPEMCRVCQLLQARGQTASTQRSGADKWSPARDTLVQSWPNNAPRLAGLIQHDCYVCRDKLRQKRWSSSADDEMEICSLLLQFTTALYMVHGITVNATSQERFVEGSSTLVKMLTWNQWVIRFLWL